MRRVLFGFAGFTFGFAGFAGLGFAWLACSLATGCGTPAAPQPPSLKLPEQVEDLSVVRAGDSVTLHWTNPRKTTDHLLIQGTIVGQVCREASAGACAPVGSTSAQPGAQSEFHETLPAALLAGEPRVLRYFVELKNTKGQSAGPSNMAETVAGSAPGIVAGLTAEVRADGVALHWAGGDAATAVRLHRKLLTVPSPAKAHEKNEKTTPEKSTNGKSTNGKPAGLMQAPKEPVESNLMVDKPAAGAQNGALDNTARFGESYEYQAQRVVWVKAGEETLELDGAFSAPIPVDVIDRFPPGAPQGLVGVAAAQEKSIDLSWEPNTEPDLAGYIVYRMAEGTGRWTRISGAQPLAAAAYRDLPVEEGRTYRYRVTAIDQSGHESAPSAETQESMPNP